MPLRNPRPVTFRPWGLVDALDGTNAPEGAMQQLANLVPDPSTDKCWVARPASIAKALFGSFTTPGFISGLLVVGDLAYGMIASGRNAGNDEPFVRNLATNAFLTVGGITAANTPTSPATSGDWTPPILAQVGSRIIVTHPGFGGGAIKFGWFDVSGFSGTITANTHNGSPTIDGNFSLAGIEPGMTITGTGIPANDTVVSTANFTLTTSVTSHSNTTLDGIASTTGIAVGQSVSTNPTLGIAAGTTVASIVGPNSVTITPAATLSATGNVTFTGTTITMLSNATADHSQETITVAGGTLTNPLWGAGDTDRNNLVAQPIGVAQFNGRAYYALGTSGIQFSDVLVPCRISNTPNVQALTTNDGLAVTAIAPLMQFAALTGAIVQALIAFEGATKMQQITGDPTTSNLAMNALPVATGTLAPLSITPCEMGTAFISPQGLRVIGFDSKVSPPIGDHGTGISVPFINAISPSRIAGAANADTLRFSVKNGGVASQPTQEYDYDITRKCWYGPHSFPFDQIEAWEATFVIVPTGVLHALFQSDIAPSLGSTYTENGTPLTCSWQTSLLPDTGQIAENALVDCTLALALDASGVTVSAYDENGQTISGEGGTLTATATVIGTGTATLWGAFKWGQAPWGGSRSALQQRAINFPIPVVFKQMSVVANAEANAALRIGDLYMRYQILGYKLQVA